MKRSTLLLAAGCFLVSLLGRGERISCAAGLLMLIIVALHDRKALVAFGSFRLWLFPMMFIALSPFCMGEQHQVFRGGHYSPEQLKKGALFLFHAYCFVVFGAYISRAFSLQEVVGIAERIGVPQMGLRIALGMGATKILSRMVRETYTTYRMTRPGYLSAVREAHILLGAIVRNTMLVAEQISILFYIRNVRIGKTSMSVDEIPAKALDIPRRARGGTC